MFQKSNNAKTRDKILNCIFFFHKIEQFGGNNTQTLFPKRYLLSRNDCCFDKRLTSFLRETTTYKLPVDTRLIFQKKFKFIPFWPSFYEVIFLLIQN